MRGKRLCYFHHESRKTHPRRVVQPILPDFPLIEDGRSIQIGLNQVMQALLHRSIDSRTATRILCCLQMAVGQVKNKE